MSDLSSHPIPSPVLTSKVEPESEIARQIDLLSRNEPVVQSTRGYDAMTGKTFHLRSKEDAPDYRYFPDPELGRVAITPVRSLAFADARILCTDTVLMFFFPLLSTR